jgi:hypothetical protein
METATWATMGPVQLVVLGFPPEAQFKGEIIRAMSDVRGRGEIRLIDALFVRKDQDGNVVSTMREGPVAPRTATSAPCGWATGAWQLAAATGRVGALGATLGAQKAADAPLIEHKMGAEPKGASAARAESHHPAHARGAVHDGRRGANGGRRRTPSRWLRRSRARRPRAGHGRGSRRDPASSGADRTAHRGA